MREIYLLDPIPRKYYWTLRRGWEKGGGGGGGGGGFTKRLLRGTGVGVVSPVPTTILVLTHGGGRL